MHVVNEILVELRGRGFLRGRLGWHIGRCCGFGWFLLAACREADSKRDRAKN
jgi:hypothetical protein